MKVPPATIRPFDPEVELAALSSIWFRASLEAHPFVGRDRLQLQQQAVERVYLPNAETWVACLDDVPVGFVSLLGDFIGALFVDPHHQGRRIGSLLLGHAVALRNELELEVYTANAAAIRFYKRHGFIEISRRPLDSEGLPFENARLRYEG